MNAAVTTATPPSTTPSRVPTTRSQPSARRTYASQMESRTTGGTRAAGGAPPVGASASGVWREVMIGAGGAAAESACRRRRLRQSPPPPAAMAALARSMGALSLSPSTRRPGLGSVAAVRGTPLVGGELEGRPAAAAWRPPSQKARDMNATPHCAPPHIFRPPNAPRAVRRPGRGCETKCRRPRAPRREGAPVQQGSQICGGDAHQKGRLERGRDGGSTVRRAARRLGRLRRRTPRRKTRILQHVHVECGGGRWRATAGPRMRPAPACV